MMVSRRMNGRKSRSTGMRAKSNSNGNRTRTNLFPTIAYAAGTAIMVITIFGQGPPISLEQISLEQIYAPTNLIQELRPSTSTVERVERRNKAIPNHCDSPSRSGFDDKYRLGIWSVKMKSPEDFYGDAQWPPKKIRQRSASGQGSYLGYTTQTSLQILKDTIRTYHIRSMVDIPCGDVNWIFDSFETDALPFYVGLDVASKVIAVNKKRFAHHTNKEFYFWDANHCTIPRVWNGTTGKEEPFDLVHVRDVIQHLSLERGVTYFCNVFSSGAKFLLTTTYPGGKHKDVQDADFYHNDLTKEPFSFPKATSCTPTHPNEEPDHTCLYDLRNASWVSKFLQTKC